MRTALLKTSKKLHNGLLWFGLVALLAFVISAATHPVMVWTGPQSKAFMPPKMQLSFEQIKQIPAVLSSTHIESALISKVVPTEHGPMLQLTTHVSEPRQYFALKTQDAKQAGDFDERQAIWLARYYTGETSIVESVSLLTEFSTEYPRVNRLLPVYRVDFDNEDNLSAYIYTETNALAGLNNDWKRSLQSVFQALHTWSWLDDYPLLRVLLTALLLSMLLLMSLSGIVFLFLIKRKKSTSQLQSWHRKLAWIAFIPLTAFIISGIYHLFQSEYGEKAKGMRLSNAIATQNINLSSEQFADIAGKKLNSFSLIEHAGKRYFRVSIAGSNRPSQKPHDHHGSNANEQRNKRFDGVAREKNAFYIAVDDVNDNVLTDEIVAEALAIEYMGLDKSSLLASDKITRFGGYDFRNKRLPVWMFEFNTANNDQLFIDPITGILVEHTIALQRYEGLSFSLLHKWNFLLAFADREQRDIAVVFMLFIFLFLTLIGFIFHWKR